MVASRSVCIRRAGGPLTTCATTAVAFEDPADVIAAMTRAGIRIGKVQVSSALELRNLLTSRPRPPGRIRRAALSASGARADGG